MSGIKRLFVGGLVAVSVFIAAKNSTNGEAIASSPAEIAAVSSTPFEPQRVSITSRDSYYYQVPTGADAMVYLFHGGGGQATDWFKRTETRYLWQLLVSRGYGVVSIDSSLGLNEGWANPLQSSAGLDRVKWVTNDLRSRDLLRDDMREYGIGASGGGNFLSFVHRAVDLEAIAVVSSTGKMQGFKEMQAKPAVIFVIGANDTENPVDRIHRASDFLNQQAIASSVVVLEPHPLTAEMLARIDGISSADGEKILQRLKSAGVLDGAGMVILSAMKYDGKILGEFSKLKQNISEQIKIAAAGHIFDRQHADDIANFFDANR